MKKKSAARSAFIALRALTALVLLAAAAFSIVSGRSITSRPVLFHSEAAANISARTLTLAERVAYQRAIEDVYWRHRIWPKERPDAKPSLDGVMSQPQLKKKVEDYLRNSQALEDYWQRPITAEQLQAEMDRMAKHTKQPEILRELFEALGNDPFLIAECLARPALAERLLTNWYAYDQRIHGELKQRAETELQTHPTVEQMKQLTGKYREIEWVKSDSAGQIVGQAPRLRNPQSVAHASRLPNAIQLTNREWDETIEKLASAFGVQRHVATFQSADVSGHSKNAAVRKDDAIPVGKLSPLQEDETRFYATAVIEKSGDHLKLATVSWLKEPVESWILRAENQTPSARIARPGSYTLPKISETSGACIDDTWTSTAGPPEGREGHTAVWTGSEMIIWGGYKLAGIPYYAVLGAGAKYNPSLNTWTVVSSTNAPSARYGHAAVWTGNEMIVWGGVPYPNIGGRYNPSTNSWTLMSTANEPTARESHTAVWTGSEMIVWGGQGINGQVNTGGRYNPNTDSWTPTNTTNAPSGRDSHTAVWSGSEMIVWGGQFYDSSSHYLNSGGKYNPATNSWTATSGTNAPVARSYHTVVWASGEMVIWGGYFYDGSDHYLNSGGRYNPAADNWVATATTGAPDARSFHTAVWAGSEMIVWGGFNGRGFGGDLDTGGRYNPGTNSWTITSTTNAPLPRDSHTAVWTGSEMIVWGGIYSDFFSGSVFFNSGGRYNPSTNNWSSTDPNNVPSGRAFHTALWTGSEMIIWGGTGDVTGGMYRPSTDTWMATTTTGAPAARDDHTAIWTGGEMIVWGGSGSNEQYFNTGGRYNPGANRWMPTSTANAPTGRASHTAVWTGNEMVVWGGFDASGDLNTGGRYNPGTDTWTPTTITNAPSARNSHTAVWTGNEMIVWGGDGDSGELNTGGRYNPSSNSWITTTLADAPSGRDSHSAVWTGSEMIVWGGFAVYLDLDTGGRYNPITDSWIATNTTIAPEPREHHTAVWTGSEMIVWAGYDIKNNTDLETGAKYNPGTDNWTATSTVNAPPPRAYHTAVWSGNEMIIWGGLDDDQAELDTGWRYCAQGGPSPTPTPTPTPCTGRCAPTPRPRPTPAPRS